MHTNPNESQRIHWIRFCFQNWIRIRIRIRFAKKLGFVFGFGFVSKIGFVSGFVFVLGKICGFEPGFAESGIRRIRIRFESRDSLVSG